MPEATNEQSPRWIHKLDVPTSDAMTDLGRQLASALEPGDLVVLTGDLGAGKTTLTQGIGQGLEVRGRISSPTFIIARTHLPDSEGPALVHVDAYRIRTLAEVDDLDLDAAVEDSVTVVEWGAGLVDDLSDDRLEITIGRERGAGGEEGNRTMVISAYGARWLSVDPGELLKSVQ